MKPILVVMAAGMGSRYGGLKQIEPVGPNGEIILDYSAYDAVRAGYGKIVFVIKEENEALFRSVAGDRIAEKVEVCYAYQKSALPEGYKLPEGRTKPWGTGHAALAAADFIDAPFTVINSDDYYGCEAFRVMHDFLVSPERMKNGESAMVGYELKNTVTENGSVSRGVCEEKEGYLVDITERTKIYNKDGGICYFDPEKEVEYPLDPETTVSMNFWGFGAEAIDEFRKAFLSFLDNDMPKNPLKAEFYLPEAAKSLIKNDISAIRVLSSHDTWYGVTYKEDKPVVTSAIAKMYLDGIYPDKLF